MSLLSHSCVLPYRSRAARCIGPVVLLIFASLGASATAQQISTSKPVYEEGEPIVVTFDGAPGNSHDMITFAYVGAPPSYNYNGQFLSGVQSGTLQFPPLPRGVYEARLIDQATSAPVAFAKLSVGPSCYDPAVADTKVCDPAITMMKNQFAVDEPLEVFFEGIPGPSNDWITIVPADSPDGQYTEYYYVKAAGRQVFKGLPPGNYEARLHLNFSGNTPYARFPFEVGDFASDVATLPSEGTDAPASGGEMQIAALPATGSDTEAASLELTRVDELPQPGIDGHWIGYLSCAGLRGNSSQAVPVTTLLFNIDTGQQAGAELFAIPRQGFGSALRMNASFAEGTRNLTLDPIEWMYPPRTGQQPLTVSATLNENGLRLSGTIDGAQGCDAFEAFKYNRDNRPRAASGLLPLIERFGEAAVSRENCMNYLRFSSQEEFVETGNVEVPEALADADGFYGMLGNTYDSWSYADHRAESRYWTECIKLIQTDRTNIEASQLVAKALNHRRLTLFLGAAPPDPDSRRIDGDAHLRFLTNYAALTGLRISRLYADLDLETARAFDATRENLTTVLGFMEDILSGSGPFTALPESDRDDYHEALLTERLRISLSLMDAAFAAFNIDSYEKALPGLIAARADEAAVVRDVESYAVSEQVDELKARFIETFAPLSDTVVVQLIEMIPAPEAAPESLIEGREHQQRATASALEYLAVPDKRRLQRAYEERNVEAARLIAPAFPNWLEQNISRSGEGRTALSRLSQGMLGVTLDKLQPERVTAPYRTLADAIYRRGEKLRFEICELPRGFEAYQDVLCSEDAIQQVFGS